MATGLFKDVWSLHPFPFTTASEHGHESFAEVSDIIWDRVYNPSIHQTFLPVTASTYVPNSISASRLDSQCKRAI